MRAYNAWLDNFLLDACQLAHFWLLTSWRAGRHGIHMIDCSGAMLVTDQRGLPRTAGRRCDIGVVEVQPEAAPEWLVFLPIVMR